MHKASWTWAVAVFGVLLLCGGNALAKKGGGGGKPGGDEPPLLADPALSYLGGNNLYVSNADGTNQTLLLAANVLAASWSPDGTELAFWSDIQGSGIYVVGSDATGLRKIADTLYMGWVTWSPTTTIDGTYRVAFTDKALLGDGSLSSPDVYVVEPDGSDRIQLTVPPGWESGLSWSPDSLRLATRTTGTNAGLILLTLGVDVAGDLVVTGTENLSDAAGSPLANADVFQPSWSRAGDHLLVTVLGDVNGSRLGDLWVIPVANPAAAWNLTNTTDSEESFSDWSPDDLHVVYKGGDAKGKGLRNVGIYVQPVDGSAQRSMLISGGQAPRWRR